MIVPLVLCLKETSASEPRLGQPGTGPLSTDLENHPGLLQQIRPHVGSDDAVPPVEADLRVLPKTAAVVVPGGLCIPDGLERRTVASAWGFVNKRASLDPNHTSVIGLDARTLSSTRALLPDLLTTAKYLMAYRADTVLPAPDSPLTMMDWFLWFLKENVQWINTVSNDT